MKTYRIIPNISNKYSLQERFLFIFWLTIEISEDKDKLILFANKLKEPAIYI